MHNALTKKQIIRHYKFKETVSAHMQLFSVQTIHVSHLLNRKKKTYPKAQIPLDKYQGRR